MEQRGAGRGKRGHQTSRARPRGDFQQSAGSDRQMRQRPGFVRSEEVEGHRAAGQRFVFSASTGHRLAKASLGGSGPVGDRVQSCGGCGQLRLGRSWGFASKPSGAPGGQKLWLPPGGSPARGVSPWDSGRSFTAWQLGSPRTSGLGRGARCLL